MLGVLSVFISYLLKEMFKDSSDVMGWVFWQLHQPSAILKGLAQSLHACFGPTNAVYSLHRGEAKGDQIRGSQFDEQHIYIGAQKTTGILIWYRNTEMQVEESLKC